jgi:hypothetical protein
VSSMRNVQRQPHENRLFIDKISFNFVDAGDVIE